MIDERTFYTLICDGCQNTKYWVQSSWDKQALIHDGRIMGWTIFPEQCFCPICTNDIADKLLQSMNEAD